MTFPLLTITAPTIGLGAVNPIPFCASSNAIFIYCLSFYLEVLTAQQTLLNARLSQVANRFTEIQGVITLYQALGGGRM